MKSNLNIEEHKLIIRHKNKIMLRNMHVSFGGPIPSLTSS